MPATPAYPPRSAPRLYVDVELSENAEIRLDGSHAHYLLKVMRIQQGEPVKLFDNRTGEYLAHVTSVGKRDLILRVDGKTRERENVPDLWLLAAPIKKDRFNWIAEKATELGIAKLIPVQTARTQNSQIKPDKLRAHMIEAAEQCERTALPVFEPLAKLEAVVGNWPEDRHLFFADERLHETGESSFRKALVAHEGPAAILIGPEGGFSDEEGDIIRALPQAVPISLGPRILRADTAAVAAISLWMAGRGDWNGPKS
ncbi:16S rRNA (uracil(1498)-N(3))-methyltransferase [Parasphingorhabdus halotolerans]|uniref:Ribosomal RNA small subunit methyltransferase E n=1 Tax=Parasphingorhabdus halotolerans TaxID=2725558 RepID=A0A6H2DJJ8_9SPHN|nr:16S rRNA (uracil(1498)-N(3))-methyltransferase [Parasphingorhabdus halotolerans]QJB68852.1 16S rRNA (uracil(1498)-N(3))-methyltransferase [Parasphingorhabdus halotolerans]